MRRLNKLRKKARDSDAGAGGGGASAGAEKVDSTVKLLNVVDS